MFDDPNFDQHEMVAYTADAASGLQAIIAIHDTRRGPSLGGVRVWSYPSTAAALADALRLSRGMTYKSALADLPLGGGKSVVLLPPGGVKSPAMLRALGRAIESLSGRYIAGADVGSDEEDMRAIRRETRHVAGTPVAHGGVGPPSPTTAKGVFVGVRTTAEALGRDLSRVHVAIQGLGAVGFGLAQRLKEAGARLTVADVDRAAVARAVNELGAAAAPPEEILQIEADILSPNALGGVLKEATIPHLRVAAVAGGANNQLATPGDGDALSRRGILYAPDYVVNAGGVIHLCEEYFGWSRAMVETRVDGIATRLAAIFGEAARTDTPTHAVADAMAERRLRPARTASSEVPVRAPEEARIV